MNNNWNAAMIGHQKEKIGMLIDLVLSLRAEIERQDQEIRNLKKSNRNWRRKCQRLRAQQPSLGNKGGAE
jgi:hypothetical protein